MQKLALLFFLSTGCLTNTERGPFGKKDVTTNDATLDVDGGGSTDDMKKEDTHLFVPEPVTASVVVSGIKTLSFTWNLTDGATSYNILEDKDGSGTFVNAIDSIESQINEYNYSISLYQNIDSKYLVQSCSSNGCADSNILEIKDLINQGIGYFKADNSDAEDFFSAPQLSENGKVMVVGAPNERSFATGVNSGQGDDNSLSGAGAAYVFENVDGSWIQTAYLKASNTSADDAFGRSVTISADGTIIAIGAKGEASKGIGINGPEEGDNSAPEAGAVYVFAKSANLWKQVAYIKASNAEESDKFGEQIVLSADGTTLAISATDDASNSTTINQGLNDNSAKDSGAVYIFTRAGNTWTQQSFLKTNETKAFGTMGFSLAISGNGNIVATNHENAIFVFERVGDTWTQKTRISPDIADEDDQFGAHTALSFDGKTLLVSAPSEDGNGKGATGNADNNSSPDSGAVYVFTETGGVWTQQAYLKSGNSASGDLFGHNLSISHDGNLFAVSSILEGSSATGVNGNQSDNNSPSSGAVYVFERINTTWKQSSYLKATNTMPDYVFGFHLTVSGDGSSLAVGSLDSSGGVGTNSDASDSSKLRSGSVFLY